MIYDDLNPKKRIWAHHYWELRSVVPKALRTRLVVLEH